MEITNAVRTLQKPALLMALEFGKIANLVASKIEPTPGPARDKAYRALFTLALVEAFRTLTESAYDSMGPHSAALDPEQMQQTVNNLFYMVHDALVEADKIVDFPTPKTKH